MKIERQTITVRDAAKIIGCSHVLLYSEIKKGNFTQVIRIGRRIVVPIAALERYLANAGSKPEESDEDKAMRLLKDLKCPDELPSGMKPRSS